MVSIQGVKSQSFVPSTYEATQKATTAATSATYAATTAETYARTASTASTVGTSAITGSTTSSGGTYPITASIIASRISDIRTVQDLYGIIMEVFMRMFAVEQSAAATGVVAEPQTIIARFFETLAEFGIRSPATYAMDSSSSTYAHTSATASADSIAY